ncbi:MAG: hypothetical protein HPY50_13725 [Firmicutes bacterium]|nr:hypothetical protein [Bacillota bacterium]
MRRRSIFFILTAAAVSVSLLLLAGCRTTQPAGPPPAASAPPESQPVLPAVSKQPVPLKSDGTISDNEYTNYQKVGDIHVFTRLEDGSVAFGLMANPSGYLALGIEPENKMKGADMIICTVRDGSAQVSDMYSTGLFGPHPPDQQLGGTYDLYDVSGSKKEAAMTFEFKRKLNTEDSQDKVLKIGQNKVIWSLGSTTDITVQHASRGYGELVLQ